GRVQIPISSNWLMNAQDPRLRRRVAYDPPVNAAIGATWVTRPVSCQLRSRPDGDARGTRNPHPSTTYPLFRRSYKLPKDAPVDDDIWLLELSYEQIGEYYPAME